MSPIALIYGAYALLLIVGGLMGYTQAKSKASLIAGIISGVVFAVLALLGVHSEKPASVVGMLVAFVLAIVFLMRFVKTRKPMPSLMLCLLSIAVGIASIIWMGLRA
jgi:uncharacterized membrane protein (UPF0136 family)